MSRGIVGVILLAFCSLLGGQTPVDNVSVVKLVKAGLSEDVILSIVKTSPCAYDTSADALIALKNSGVSDKLISAMVVKASVVKPPAQSPPGNSDPNASGAEQSSFVAPATREPSGTNAMGVEATNRPRVFLQSASKGSNRNAARDQSMEMSKDFERDCPGVRVTINDQMADYTVLLNHIEVGLIRDNQIQVANKDGDLLSKTKEGGSIAKGSKKACALILADWASKTK